MSADLETPERRRNREIVVRLEREEWIARIIGLLFLLPAIGAIVWLLISLA